MSARVVIVPGLGDSGPGHWQSHLQRAHEDSVRVRQDDWSDPDLDRWSDAIARMLPDGGAGAVVVAHSFGCLAVANVARRMPARIRAALLVAPANPARFALAARLPRAPLEVPVVVVASANDPWCPLERARGMARRWGAQFLSIGRAGHINVDSGHGKWPLGERLVETLLRVHGGEPRAAPPLRPGPARAAVAAKG